MEGCGALEALEARVVQLQAHLAEQQKTIAEKDARIAELEGKSAEDSRQTQSTHAVDLEALRNELDAHAARQERARARDPLEHAPLEAFPSRCYKSQVTMSQVESYKLQVASYTLLASAAIDAPVKVLQVTGYKPLVTTCELRVTPCSSAI